jgi:hypothetical protein
LVIGAPPMVLRKPIIPETAVQRCWQSHPFRPHVPAHVPTPGHTTIWFVWIIDVGMYVSHWLTAIRCPGIFVSKSIVAG